MAVDSKASGAGVVLQFTAKCGSESKTFTFPAAHSIGDLVRHCDLLFGVENSKLLGLTKGKLPEAKELLSTLKLDANKPIKLMVVGTKRASLAAQGEADTRFEVQRVVEEEQKRERDRLAAMERARMEREAAEHAKVEAERAAQWRVENEARAKLHAEQQRKADAERLAHEKAAEQNADATVSFDLRCRFDDSAESSGKLVLPAVLLQQIVNSKVAFPLTFEITPKSQPPNAAHTAAAVAAAQLLANANAQRKNSGAAAAAAAGAGTAVPMADDSPAPASATASGDGDTVMNRAGSATPPAPKRTPPSTPPLGAAAAAAAAKGAGAAPTPMDLGGSAAAAAAASASVARSSTYRGVHEFQAPANTVYVPLSVLQDLQVPDGTVLHLKSVNLPRGTFASLQPLDSAWPEVGPEPERKALLELELRRRTFLSKGDTIAFAFNRQRYSFTVSDTKPAPVIAISNTDLEVDILPPVDAAPLLPVLDIAGAPAKPTPGAPAAAAASAADAASATAPVAAPIAAELKAAGAFAYFKLTIDDAAAVVLIDVKPTAGDADVYVATEQACARPTHLCHEWKAQSRGAKQLVLSQADAAFRTGAYVVGVRAFDGPAKFTVSAALQSHAAANAGAGHRLGDGKDGKTSPPMGPRASPPAAVSALPAAAPAAAAAGASEKVCSHCRKPMPASALAMHELRCARQNWVCPDCPVTSGVSAVYPVTEKAKHTALVHATYACDRGCGVKGLAGQTAAVLHALHDCPLRLVTCIYCPLRVVKADAGAHQNECGAREATCLVCRPPTLHKRKEIRRHHLKTHNTPVDAVVYGQHWI